MVRRPGFEPGAVRLEGACAVPLRQRRSVPPRGLEPLQSRIKSPVPGQSGASGVGREGLEPAHLLLIVLATGQSAPVESNHALPAYQAGPFTGWAEAVVRRRDRELNPEGRSPCSTVFETAAVAIRLASPRDCRNRSVEFRT